MTEVALARLLDMGLTALQIGIERQAIVDNAARMEAEGKSAAEITEAIRKMRDEKIAEAKLATL